MPRSVDPTGLLYLLAVARGRTHTAAAATLGVSHTTVARRVRALERDVGERLLVASLDGWELTAAGARIAAAGEAVEEAMRLVPAGSGAEPPVGLHGLVHINSTEIFGLMAVVPALSEVHASHPKIAFELSSVTRPMHTYGPTADLDIGVTKPTSGRLTVRKLTEYELGVFATSEYLAQHTTPGSLSELTTHSPIYYVESMLGVADLDLVDRLFAQRSEVVGATSVLAQLEMTRRGMGVGILPAYLARDHPDLVRLLPQEAKVGLTYWMSSRAQNYRRPEVRAVADAIQRQCRRVFVGTSGSRGPSGQ
jgi:DNA-binding transcriptional LysR family regulator